jgi:ATP phosphoribosyltransferase
MLTIAVSKGRIYEEALPLLAEAGITPIDDPQKSRKLILATTRPDVQLVIIRATDVPTFVEYGAADLGIAGKDVLMEHGSDSLYEPLDLGIAGCRLMTAARVDAPEIKGRIRVATKYVKTAQRYFADLGVQAEIIKLYGSME